jgi:hypothetical protein
MDGWCVGGCGVTLFAVGWFVLTPESQLAMVDDNYLSAVSWNVSLVGIFGDFELSISRKVWA